MNDDATEKRHQKKKAQKKTDSTVLGEQLGFFFSSGSLNETNSHV